MTYMTHGFYGCCGAKILYFAQQKVQPDRLSQTEEKVKGEGYGVIMCIVRQQQSSTRILEAAGWSMVAISKGRGGARLNTWVKVLKPFTPKPRKVEKARTFA